VKLRNSRIARYFPHFKSFLFSRILPISPTWRRVMTMTSKTSLHLMYTYIIQIHRMNLARVRDADASEHNAFPQIYFLDAPLRIENINCTINTLTFIPAISGLAGTATPTINVHADGWRMRCPIINRDCFRFFHSENVMICASVSGRKQRERSKSGGSRYFERGGETMFHPRCHVSQMHIMNYTRFIWEKATYRKTWGQ